MNDSTVSIPRHKTAIRRGDFSRPVKCLLRDGLVDPTVSLFDYGCGRGEDVELLQADGVTCTGWDPAYRPHFPRQEADVVNLGYVLNVIEDLQERSATLRSAWGLCRRLLTVAAQVLMAGRGKTPVAFGDGVLTGRGTFQKFYDQDELKAYLECELGTEAIPAAPGVFYLFKDDGTRQAFLANQYRRREIAPRRREGLPRQRQAERQFEEHRALLQPLIAAVASLGRLPEPDELPAVAAIVDRFGSLKRAFALVRRATGDEEWDLIRRRRVEDLLVYLALSRFRKRPTFTQLPRTLQADMRAFFGAYTKACKQADELLFQAGDAQAIDDSCRRSTVGKLLPDDLYVHRSALDQLEPLLRIYEGCARSYLGEIEGANIIKIHRRSGKVSYLVYPRFDEDPHPALLRCVRLCLRTRELQCIEYADRENPPILHRKESFLCPEHPLHGRFARLTQQEEKAGLLDEAARIGTRNGWQVRLTEKGMTLRGHRLIRLASSEAPDCARDDGLDGQGP